MELVDLASGNAVFSNSYRADETEAGVGAGIFASVEPLRALGERALRNAVDQARDDPAFSRASARD